MPLSKTTRDHDTIRKWAERRGAMPAEVAGTEKGKQTGILRFAFPKAKGHNDGKLQEVSWDEFFQKFDDNGLELIYQEKTAAGAESNFNKLIYPENESSGNSGKKTSDSASSGRQATPPRSSSAGKTAAGGAAAKRAASSVKSGSSKARSSSSSSAGRSSQKKRAA